MRITFVIALLVLCGVLGTEVSAMDSPTHWSRTGTGSTYQAEGLGDPQSVQGATVSLSSSGGAPEKFGGALTSLDATAFRGHTVTLSGELSTRDAERGAAIWLRADGPTGHLAFTNSQDVSVTGTSPAVHREIQIDVPATATQLVYGVLLVGNGEVTAERLRLATGALTIVVPPNIELDAAIRIVRSYALHSSDVDWNVVEPEIRAMTKDAKVSRDVYPAITAMLKKLNDHHSFLMDPQHSRAAKVEGVAREAPVVMLRQGQLGYVSIPGYVGIEQSAMHTFATTMVDAIGKIAPDARCGWIVDLRHDGGGNMRPMLMGVRPLLGTPPWGSFRDAAGHLSPLRVGRPLEVSVPTGPNLSAARVAVLTGPRTASSGEVVAIAFRGRAHTRSFGAATAGLSTGNTAFALPDGSQILLTTAVDMDRAGQAYGGKLEPDQTVEDDPDDSVDHAAMAAEAWLTESCPH